MLFTGRSHCEAFEQKGKRSHFGDKNYSRNKFRFSSLKQCLNQINGVTGSQWLGSDILEYSVKIAKSLHHAGIRENDVVSILSDNRFEFLGVAFGTIFLNAHVAPINFHYSKSYSSQKPSPQ